MAPIPAAAPDPARPIKCPLPMLLANKEAPIWTQTDQIRAAILDDHVYKPMLNKLNCNIVADSPVVFYYIKLFSHIKIYISDPHVKIRIHLI